MKIGVLALQGDFAEHIHILKKLGIDTAEVRLPEQLKDLDGLIIPGGESTTMGKLAIHYGFMEPICEFAGRKAVWGTCAGAILLSKSAHLDQPLLNLMDIQVERNAYGRQVASFEIDLQVPALQKVDPDNRPYHAIFIRAPLIELMQGEVVNLAALPDGRVAAAQQGRWLATAFNPELTEDDRFHRYFIYLADHVTGD